MDAVYDWSRFNSLPRGYEWIKGTIKKEPKFGSELIEVTTKYGNIATTRRIGYLLDTLGMKQEMINRLRIQLGASSSLIPWIPGRSSRGPINRKWGIIIND